MTDFALQASHLSKHYDDGLNRIDVLVDVSIAIARGEMVADPIVGGDGTGFYLAYLDSAFAASAKNLLPSKRVRPR